MMPAVAARGFIPSRTTALDLTRIDTAAAAAPAPRIEAPPRGRGGFGGGGFGDPQWAKDGRSLYYLQGGGIYSVGITPSRWRRQRAHPPVAADCGGGRGRRGGGGGGAAPTAAASDSSATPRRVSFTVRMEVDHVAERREVFEEAWRAMKNRFYDRDMHGVDWAAAKKLYEPLLGDIADNEELHTVIMQMIGELNASHTGISGGGNPGQAPERDPDPLPGLRPRAGCLRLLQGLLHLQKRPRRPRLREAAKGQFHPRGQRQGIEDQRQLLEDVQPRARPQIRIHRQLQARRWMAPGPIGLDPLSSAAQGNLNYDRWVDDRRAMVEKLSDGKVGYLHIKAMDAPSLQKFERDLLENRDKKALIIDQRFNGGGGIDQELLEILNQRKQYRFYRGRDSVDVPAPRAGILRPDGGVAERALGQQRRNVPRLASARWAGQGDRRAHLRRGDRHRRLPAAGRLLSARPRCGVYTAEGREYGKLRRAARRHGRQHARRISLPATTGRSRKPSKSCAPK